MPGPALQWFVGVASAQGCLVMFSLFTHAYTSGAKRLIFSTSGPLLWGKGVKFALRPCLAHIFVKNCFCFSRLQPTTHHFWCAARVKIAPLPKQGHPTPFQLSRASRSTLAMGASISIPAGRSWEFGECLVASLVQRVACCLPGSKMRKCRLKNRKLVLPWCETQNSHGQWREFPQIINWKCVKLNFCHVSQLDWKFQI